MVYGCFLKWWYLQNTPKWSFFVGKPIVVGYHHFRKPPSLILCCQGKFNLVIDRRRRTPGPGLHHWPRLGVGHPVECWNTKYRTYLKKLHHFLNKTNTSDFLAGVRFRSTLPWLCVVWAGDQILKDPLGSGIHVDGQNWPVLMNLWFQNEIWFLMLLYLVAASQNPFSGVWKGVSCALPFVT